MSNWLILGCGPTAGEWLLEAAPNCTVSATCNDGIEMIPNPDYYAMVEQGPFEQFKLAYRAAQERGTKLISHDKTGGRFHDRIDVIVPVLGPQEFEIQSWAKGLWRNACTAGSLIVQYAANNGATEIHLVGMDGYTQADGPDQLVKTHCYQGPLLARMAQVMPQTTFIFYGRPRYEIADLPNVKCNVN